VNDGAQSDVKLAFDESGSGDALLLVHGLGTNRRVWRAATSELGGRWRVLAPDLPGFGESAPVDGGFGLDAAADAVAALAVERGGGPVDVVGHSLGGAVTIRLARRHPELVRRLVLFAPAGLAPRPGLLATALATGAPPFLAARRLIGRPLAGSRVARRAVLFGAVHDAGRLSSEDARELLSASRGARSLRPAARVAIVADVHDELDRLECPLGLLWGERDLVVSARVREQLARRRSDLPVETVPAAGHVAQAERPREFVAALERLLERLPITV
jgi:pimeloyl-ACP methyl ester carboxylesterase